MFLDVLGLTRTGRLVLVKCKLWRNPQSRRDVVAQVLEYAALLRGWSFGDLTARLKQRHGYAGENPIFAKARQFWQDLNEAAFVDGIARSLQLGDFHLVIAGDGTAEIMLENNDEWAVSRRYMTLETLGVVSDNPLVRLPVLPA